MSAELERLESQLRRAFAGDAWHGPSVLESLAGVSAADAFAHPIADAHSIWELVLHLGGTYGLVLRRLGGDNAPLAPTDDWPPVPAPTPEAWSAAVAELRARNARVREAVLRFDAGRLDAPLPEGCAYTAHTQFIGITQHDLYHAGQIALLRKARAATER